MDTENVNATTELLWPEWIYEEILTEAVRLNTSLSWCAQRAWTLARPTLTRLQRASELAEVRAGGSYRQVLTYFPIPMLEEIQVVAERIDCTISLLTRHARLLAAEQIKATEPDEASE